MNKICIAGGGPAGMIAGVFAARAGCSVTLIEQNEKLGKKLFLTGKGRCNVTNACETEELFSSMVTNEKFMYSSFYGFDNRMVMAFFEELGVPLKVERGNRVFPVSDHSSDIIKALQYELRRLGVEVLLNTKVKELLLEKTEGEEKPRIKGVALKNGNVLEADRVLLATGGLSYPSTGATGDGYKMAEKAGHKVTELYPALVPLVVKESWCHKLQGLSLKNVSAKIMQGKKLLYEGFGELLFTHFGVSGPLMLTASSYLTKKLKEPAVLILDLKPALSEKQLDDRLLREFEANNNKQFKNILGSLFPAKLIPVMLQMSPILPEKKCNEISKEERRAFLELVKNLEMTITGTRGFEEAIITQGGLSVKEVNPSTMESKRVEGLYFAGEVLDLDAVTGGYNLQIAWSTGYLAAMAMSE
ncbi:MAG: NAD(P)/FAD-dependent oxidoreductase [Roseburia sp.]|nr:NAD(P)/FAD-dependent oxidoreductase [Roseburia sp.]MCM1278145.1 NAD(P)/FAD-dependent oxidoreductase [Robinsoniella sp.]